MTYRFFYNRTLFVRTFFVAPFLADYRLYDFAFSTTHGARGVGNKNSDTSESIDWELRGTLYRLSYHGRGKAL